MKDRYKWYQDPDEDGIGQFWDECIVTLDASVLLDMYRYQASTRKRLIDVLRFFSPKLWLTAQATEEFFRNRKKTIRAKNGSYDDALGDFNALSSHLDESLARLKKTRVLDDDVLSELATGVRKKISEVGNAINSAKEEIAISTLQDNILLEIYELFDKKISNEFSGEEYQKESQEAAKRFAQKIPPGYKDSEKKTSYNKYGDYFIWRQLLLKCKESELDAVLVTSEKKEDWFEEDKYGVVGPRFELVKEAYDFSGRRIVIISPDQFLRFASDYISKKSETDIAGSADMLRKAIEEIKRVVAERNRRSRGTVHQVSHMVMESSGSRFSGEVVIEVNRSISVITTQIKFSPPMGEPPGAVKVFLVDQPSNMPEYKIVIGECNSDGFSMHINPSSFGVTMPAGFYVVRYEAALDDRSQHGA